ncbi:hypothetical protein H2201_005119 [Coniosporium apollinis]|uniref:Uncharacterized protein n=1 Tax=Coniosporium apollinis TaxID=61459 RepID=A0ABQ9NQP1_9PEZI|nr:hypothetical protein H2201_005119 [Coniosporium apollinis]
MPQYDWEQFKLMLTEPEKRWGIYPEKSNNDPEVVSSPTREECFTLTPSELDDAMQSDYHTFAQGNHRHVTFFQAERIREPKNWPKDGSKTVQLVSVVPTMRGIAFATDRLAQTGPGKTGAYFIPILSRLMTKIRNVLPPFPAI